MILLLVRNFLLNVELAVHLDLLGSLLVEVNAELILVLDALLLAILHFVQIKLRIGQMLGKLLSLYVLLCLVDCLLDDGLYSQATIWVILSKLEIEVADLCLSTVPFLLPLHLGLSCVSSRRCRVNFEEIVQFRLRVTCLGIHLGEGCQIQRRRRLLFEEHRAGERLLPRLLEYHIVVAVASCSCLSRLLKRCSIAFWEL